MAREENLWAGEGLADRYLLGSYSYEPQNRKSWQAKSYRFDKGLARKLDYQTEKGPSSIMDSAPSEKLNRESIKVRSKKACSVLAFGK